MPTMTCTEPVCRHEWTYLHAPRRPRCPRCGGFWVRVESYAPRPAVRQPPAPLAAMRYVAPLSFE